MTPGVGQRAGGLGRTQILALALATGTAAALLAYAALAHGTTIGHDTQTVPVVTAAHDLPPRQVLSAAMLRVIAEPISAAPAGTFRTTTALIGKVTAAIVLAGQPLTASKVTTRDRTTGMAALIAPSLRAVTVPLDAAGGAVGFLEPGDHVDVLATFGTGDGLSVARVVVSDAHLLALGGHVASDADTDGPATSATLEVTPQAAQALALAAARGRMTLALRSLGDDAVIPLPDLPGADVAGPTPPPLPTPHIPASSVAPAARAAPAPAATIPSAPPQVTILRGTQQTTMTVGE